MALDTFNPYLFVSAGEQSNKFLMPTYAGGIAQFQAQRAQSLTGLTVRIDPIQEGSGDPSPENIRPISGRTGLTVTVQSGDTQNTYPVTWQTEAGEVYGGTLNVTTGVLTVEKVLIDLGSITSWRYNQSGAGAFDTNGNLNPIAKNNDCICTNYKTLENPSVGKITSGDNLVCINKKDDGTGYTGSYATGTLVVKDSRYSDVETFKAAMDGVMLCYTLATPQTYQLSPTDVKTLAGFNQVYSDAGPVIDIRF